jgi:AraC-like DNA-binding protein
MALIIAWSLTGVTADGLFFVKPARESGATGELNASTWREGDRILRPGDAQLIRSLQELMTTDRVYRREGLTIGTLALKLGVPEYKTRRLINQSLGYRNFNAFLNKHRIDEAKTALADPAQAEVSVLTIALDAGFQSLGPFNRAFKAETGLTPTEYRSLQLRQTSSKPLPAWEDFRIGKSA